MSPSTTMGGDSERRERQWLPVLVVIVVVLALRLLHLGAAVASPLTYQLGPDEDYYLRFGIAIAQGIGSGDPEFAFMDPAYGHVLGALAWLFGAKVYPIFLLQALVDTLTALVLFAIARELGHRRAGLYAALAYGLTGTAIVFSASILKATWVANYMAIWVWLALLVVRRRAWWLWLLLGLWCGYGVALRSNLLLMALLAIPVIAVLVGVRDRAAIRLLAPRIACFLLALSVPLLLLSLRNERMSQHFSPIPNNGGIVLHQLYNPENPTAEMDTPRFVRFSQPSQIWRDYAREAERIAGRRLTPHEVDAFWRGQAMAYLRSHPRQVAENVLRKAGEFIGNAEIANNRSYEQERLFSPVIATLPAPFAWLLALGAPGLAWLVRRDRRGWALLVPIAVAFATVIVFFSEDRFRFHAVPMLALGAGLFLGAAESWIRQHAWPRLALGAATAAILAALSLWLASRVPAAPPGWERVAWGYLKMGRADDARRVAERVAREQPGNSRMREVLGYIALQEGRDGEAAALYQRAVELNPQSDVAHYNLARLLARGGDADRAVWHARAAVYIAPLPEYRAWLAELEAARREGAQAPPP